MKIIQNNYGLKAEILDNGAVRSIVAGPIRIGLNEASLFSEPCCNIYLRIRNQPVVYHPLTGAGSNSRFGVHDLALHFEGAWLGLEYSCRLELSSEGTAWQWKVGIRNTSAEAMEMDLILVQDVGLKTAAPGPVNEYYVAQYLERRIIRDPVQGHVVFCRQNMKEVTGHPWLMLKCTGGAASASTDGMQFYGPAYRSTGIPQALTETYLQGEMAGESSVTALQEKPFSLEPGETHQSVFVAVYQADHPGATSEKDLETRVPLFIDTQVPVLQPQSGQPMISAQVLNAEALSEQEVNEFFGHERRFPEFEDRELLSFFHGHNHVVLKAKELLCYRPHAHIIQASSGLTPCENMMSTTAFAFGVFNAHLTQGNTNFNSLLSVCTSQFNQSHESGQRIFVEIHGKYKLLGVPSAFEMGLNHCRWIYKFEDHLFEFRTWTSRKYPRIHFEGKLLRGSKVRLILMHDLDPMNQWSVSPGRKTGEWTARPAADSMIGRKFSHPRFRMQFACDADFGDGLPEEIRPGLPDLKPEKFFITTGAASRFSMSFIGEVTGDADPKMPLDSDLDFAADVRVAITEWKDLSLGLDISSPQQDLAAIREILPWYGMNALIHYLTPYGLEQFGGAAWGTRDVSQGPVELLLTLEKYAEAREVLCTIFARQNPDGGWPQWWMFDRYHEIRAHEAHGDIVYWTIIALANYIRVTGDLEILREMLPFYHPEGPEKAETRPLSEHIDRLVALITASFIPGTALVPFGGGDWNDSLQPVSADLANRLISSWTVEMNYQAFSDYARVYHLDHQPEKAKQLELICDKIRSDFNQYLVRDGIVAGYGLVEEKGRIGVLLHPSDQITGVKFSLLPMERGIVSGIFTAAQAKHHLELIEEHLTGPDGARLMDRPLKYKGGLMEIFQRAESSTFFGREIGLMYIHEHIRYAEALAGTGHAEAFVRALRQAIPVAYQEKVPMGDRRQANCYYSSSDVIFTNRYEADQRYREIMDGQRMLTGGWRVYSSGPGIFTGIVITRLLGIRLEAHRLVLDPVLPGAMDGLQVTFDILDFPVILTYHVEENNYSPKKISINGNPISFDREEQPYRPGGAVIPREVLYKTFTESVNFIEIFL